jgi:hypothetical protein
VEAGTAQQLDQQRLDISNIDAQMTAQQAQVSASSPGLWRTACRSWSRTSVHCRTRFFHRAKMPLVGLLTGKVQPRYLIAAGAAICAFAM